MANSLSKGEGLAGVNWAKAGEVGLGLLLSPAVGFLFAGLLLLAMRVVFREPRLYKPPEGDDRPPRWVRGILVATCGGVSFAHGSNDGQKGMGLIMLVLVALLPATFALHLATSPDQLARIVAASRAAQPVFEAGAGAVRVDNPVDVDRNGTADLTDLMTIIEHIE